MAFLKWLFALSFIIAAVAFSIANHNIVSLTWSPFHKNISVPIYALLLIFMSFGFFIGSLLTWLGMGKVRQERRIFKRENKKLEKELNKREKETTYASKADPLTKIIKEENKKIEKFS